MIITSINGPYGVRIDTNCSGCEVIILDILSIRLNAVELYWIITRLTCKPMRIFQKPPTNNMGPELIRHI